MQQEMLVKINATMLVPWQKRLLNVVIDIVIVLLILMLFLVLGVVFSFFGFDGILTWFDNIDEATDRVVTTLVMSVYLFISEFFTQRSVGKLITGTMVVMEDGSKPTAKAILIRAACRILSIEALSFLRKYPRGWHDTASNTFVVDARKYKAAVALKKSFHEIGNEISAV